MPRPVCIRLALALAFLAAADAGAQPVAQEFDRLHFRSIGPATMSGRIADLAVYEANPAIYYAGTAHGGVFKTTSNGATWEALFQDQGLISIGDVTISQTNPDLVWVGTGESNNRQSTSWGNGVWKSTDGGKTFAAMGLAGSYHINRILIHPVDNDIVFVAATGSLWGPGGDRGVYKSTDGGRTWKQVLKGDADTGANDIVMLHGDPNVMYASMYQRRRSACCMNGGGPGSGIFKSTDGGETWTRLAGGGLPEGPLGRIALDAYRRNGEIVYALIEAPSGQPQNATGFYRSDDAGRTWTKVNSANPRPMYFSQITIDPTNPDVVYLGGVGLHMTIDGGKTFATDAAMATHDDVHAIWVNPSNPQHILIGNDGGLAVSYDQSKTWTFVPNLAAGLFYHVSYDLERPFNICGGMQDNYNWCGPSASRFSRGIMNYDWFQVQGGDGFVAMPDLRDPRIVYTESQDGNIIRRDKVTGESKSIRPTGLNVVGAAPADRYRWHWDTPMMLSPHDPGLLIVAANRVFASRDRGDSWTALSPDLTTDANRDTVVTMGVKNLETRIARNDGVQAWPTIVALAESPRQAGVFYTGTDDGTVSVSRDGGANWQNITAQLPGFPAGAYVSEVVPSRFEAGRVYVTVDNHRANDYETYIWASEDFGRTFRSLRSNLGGQNVRTLTEDTRNPDVLYIGTETGIFLTLDRGRSWRRLGANLPTVRVDEITIHPRDNAMLVATHGRSLWILDNLEPIQEYSAAQVADAALFSPPTALQWKAKDDRNDEFWGHQFFVGENPPTDAVVQYHLKKAANDVKLVISDAAGRSVRTLEADSAQRQPGIQTLCWDQRIEPIRVQQQQGAPGARQGQPGGPAGQQPQQRANIPGVPTPLPSGAPGICGGGGGGGFGGFGGGGGNAGPHVAPGTYQVALMVDGRSYGPKPLTIVMDPQVRLAGADRERWNAIVADLHAAHQRGSDVAGELTSLARRLADAKVDSAATLPGEVRAQYDAFRKEFDAVRVKFGVTADGRPQQQAGFGRGGGGGDPANVLARLGGAKGAIQNIWEVPSPAVTQAAEEAKTALAAAITEAEGVLQRAEVVANALRPHGVNLR